ncbi:MAG TPA: tRNA (adenosine(37)-N6)-threonylcarbamoyltransferase complex ATPase subunit type 1 TsaE [Chromatiaceae bacterium]|jgi:tRNA threonylcarbamoyladenosine biosynthesis protein TsaE|nr:tRNA (adenosine(37)-N6)-threonylcarbamoyltransferase complex ATPase subunit type 1 TsaE [Chromatiaceae bacterium]HIN81441.1 tRNA (adenosine(37)-N6)-threonylcarbamoyltransferase complex ATPase subunit type 1 TsaE [Chromatiales bacterium]HIA09164.1 tRNA (adenosine(37)-N6)-threonylcarbamoyltransferase complex ATPase subunit type 1 TsaE [Chromatiaceae bacterium]HIB84823.1 tRNA (adenosine(37)-N6)-threonylcarbamoyltransferase complex ATPase subunit type 1 TsaE [Chromatiaceae bacterium]HIO14464.1 t
MSESTTVSIAVTDDAAMRALGAQLGRHCPIGGCVYLVGELGAGKTTLVRGLIQSLGYNGAVKSPTFTIMEPYDLGDREIYHLDLYRLADPEELEYLGIRDYLGDTALLLVEWPNLGAGVVPDPDLRVEIAYDGAARRVDLVAVTEAGHAAVRQFS